MSFPNPSTVIERLFQAYGGRDAFFAAMDKRFAEFNHAWDQDTGRIGRVLRAHLAVEHFLTMYLQARNPNLAALEKARLSFAQKVELLSPEDKVAGMLIPGLRLIGQIRNRVAHKLRVELTEQDEQAFLAIEMFVAMREESRKRPMSSYAPRSGDPRLNVLEDFAKFASGTLHSGANPDNDLWVAALAGDLSSATSEDPTNDDV